MTERYRRRHGGRWFRVSLSRFIFFDYIECHSVSAVIQHSQYLMGRINRLVQRLSASPVESY